MTEANQDPLSILSPEEIQWFREWLSKQQITQAIHLELHRDPHCQNSVIFNVLEAMRSRVENGLAPTGKLWEEPSEEKTQKSISELQQRAKELLENCVCQRPLGFRH